MTIENFFMVGILILNTVWVIASILDMIENKKHLEYMKASYEEVVRDIESEVKK